jgi:hypothetical protein
MHCCFLVKRRGHGRPPEALVQSAESFRPAWAAPTPRKKEDEVVHAAVAKFNHAAGNQETLYQRTATSECTMFAMFIGALFSGYVIGNITSLINNMHQEELEKKAIRDNVKSFCKSHRLPPELSWKVRRLINYQMEHQGLYDEKAILSSLPHKVQNDVIDSIVTDNLSKFEYLKGKPPAFCADLLNAALPYLYAANETVWRQGDAPDQIVFIINGEMCSIQDGDDDEEDARANAFMIIAGKGSK